MILEPGDILLWRIYPGASLLDRFVGWGENKILKQAPISKYQYYHVAFVAANPKNYYSAQPPKIDKFLVPDPLPDNVEVYRWVEPLSSDGLNKVFQYAESRRGSWYPFLGVLTAGWLSGNLEFCSQYTEDSFAHYPRLLSPNIRFTTPDDIASSSELIIESSMLQKIKTN